MIYTKDEIDSMKNTLMNTARVCRKDCQLAADMIDDLQHALKVYDGFATYLAIHGMLPQGSKEDTAKFWNRPQDVTNTRVWEH